MCKATLQRSMLLRVTLTRSMPDPAHTCQTTKRIVLSRSLTSSTEDVAAVAELVRSHYTATGAILFSGVLLEVPIPTHWVLTLVAPPLACPAVRRASLERGAAFSATPACAGCPVLRSRVLLGLTGLRCFVCLRHGGRSSRARWFCASDARCSHSTPAARFASGRLRFAPLGASSFLSHQGRRGRPSSIPT